MDSLNNPSPDMYNSDQLAPDEMLLSEAGSAELAGVSAATLRQFVQFGFLSAVESEGALYFREEDIRSVFATDYLGNNVSYAGDEEVQPASLQEQIEVAHFSSAGQRASEPESEPELELELAPEPELDPDPEPVLAPEPSPVHVIQADEISAAQNSDDNVVSQYELIAMNRRLREEIRMLRDERDWLRGRVEKLESRGERDQMLLVSESQTIKSLVSHRGKRGFWQTLALPWK